MSSVVSSAPLLLCLAVLIGIVSLGWLALVRDGEERGRRGVSLDALGFLPNEDIHTLAVGQLLFSDEHLVGGGVDNPSFVKTTLTTHERLLVDVNGSLTWFDAVARPRIRPIGRIMMNDKTSLVGLLTGVSETVLSFVPDGTPSPPGAVPKRLELANGAVEDVYVLELTVAGRPPLRFEAIRPAAMALCQWSRAGRPRAALEAASMVAQALDVSGAVLEDHTLRSRRMDPRAA
ncbi:MAG: hypothetical protein JST00_24700 [Deltaproteobacteria bacterium]|nr:hypothetical protein [Deltaproteobacteria bacterium]